MSRPQPGILADLSAAARYCELDLVPGADPRPALGALAPLTGDGSLVVGVGAATVRACDASVDGLRPIAAPSDARVDVPSTPTALWCWLRGTDRGEVVLASRKLAAAVAPAYRIARTTDAFVHREGRDLSGYVDGTENPTGEDAEAAALVRGRGPGLDGSSFVAAQRWVHDFAALEHMTAGARDLAIGRRIADDTEIDDAPATAHVKRTAQEGFDPPAFVVRRSMPWNDAKQAGLVFVAFGHSLDAFDALLARMVGADDGVVDALFGFTRPETGCSAWCPPMDGDRCDWSVLGV